jgi:hypothetical protein
MRLRVDEYPGSPAGSPALPKTLKLTSNERVLLFETYCPSSGTGAASGDAT